VRYVFEGTHSGAFLGFPASGKKVWMDVQGIYRFANGTIVEAWVIDDIWSAVLQIKGEATPVLSANETAGYGVRHG
jgi:predicted ester cyclase